MRVRSCLILLVLIAAASAGATICVTPPAPKVPFVRGVVAIAVEGGLCPLPGVELELQRGKFRARVNTDEDGYFAFTHIAPGPYVLACHLDGLADITSARLVVDPNLSSEQVLLLEMKMPTVGGCGGFARAVTADEAQSLQEAARSRQSPPN